MNVILMMVALAAPSWFDVKDDSPRPDPTPPAVCHCGCGKVDCKCKKATTATPRVEVTLHKKTHCGPCDVTDTNLADGDETFSVKRVLEAGPIYAFDRYPVLTAPGREPRYGSCTKADVRTWLGVTASNSAKCRVVIYYLSRQPGDLRERLAAQGWEYGDCDVVIEWRERRRHFHAKSYPYCLEEATNRYLPPRVDGQLWTPQDIRRFVGLQ